MEAPPGAPSPLALRAPRRGPPCPLLPAVPPAHRPLALAGGPSRARGRPGARKHRQPAGPAVTAAPARAGPRGRARPPPQVTRGHGAWSQWPFGSCPAVPPRSSDSRVVTRTFPWIWAPRPLEASDRATCPAPALPASPSSAPLGPGRRGCWFHQKKKNQTPREVGSRRPRGAISHEAQESSRSPPPATGASQCRSWWGPGHALGRAKPGPRPRSGRTDGRLVWGPEWAGLRT